MDYLVICTTALVVAALTLVSGFGLGTLLMPAFSVFIPLPVAIAATAVVHLANNLFKVALVGKWARLRVILWFGVPAVIAAVVGAQLMLSLKSMEPIGSWRLGRAGGMIEPIKLIIAAALAFFAAIELHPRFAKLSFPAAMLPVGGVLSGFFGGLSGMQGALRAAFLVRAGLTKDQFVGSAAVVSTMVDVARLLVYAAAITGVGRGVQWRELREPRLMLLVTAACLAAFAGSYFGAKVVRKVTLRTVQRVVAAMLIVFATALGLGLI